MSGSTYIGGWLGGWTLVTLQGSLVCSEWLLAVNRGSVRLGGWTISLFN